MTAENTVTAQLTKLQDALLEGRISNEMYERLKGDLLSAAVPKQEDYDSELDEEEQSYDFGYDAPEGGWTDYEREFLIGVEDSLRADQSWLGKLAAWEWHRLPAEKKRFFIHHPEKGVRYAKWVGARDGFVFGYFGVGLLKKLLGR